MDWFGVILPATFKANFVKWQKNSSWFLFLKVDFMPLECGDRVAGFWRHAAKQGVKEKVQNSSIDVHKV